MLQDILAFQACYGVIEEWPGAENLPPDQRLALYRQLYISRYGRQHRVKTAQTKPKSASFPTAGVVMDKREPATTKQRAKPGGPMVIGPRGIPRGDEPGPVADKWEPATIGRRKKLGGGIGEGKGIRSGDGRGLQSTHDNGQAQGALQGHKVNDLDKPTRPSESSTTSLLPQDRDRDHGTRAEPWAAEMAKATASSTSSVPTWRRQARPNTSPTSPTVKPSGQPRKRPLSPRGNNMFSLVHWRH